MDAYLDHVDCSVVSEQLYHRYMNISCHVLPYIGRPPMPFLNILRSYRACVHVCVFVHAYDSGRNKTTVADHIMIVDRGQTEEDAGMDHNYLSLTIVVF